MVKIAFATSSFRGGGITSYAFEFIKAFKDHYELSVLIGDDSKAPIVEDNVKVYKCESDDISKSNAENAIHLIQDVIIPDILFISNSKIVTLITPYLPDKIKIITICHSQKYIEADLGAFQAKYLDNIITLSQYGDKYVKNRFRIKNNLGKCKIIPNFVHSLPNVNSIIQSKMTNEPFRILFMGGSSGSKSPDIVFKILKGLKKTNKQFAFYWLGSDIPPMKRFLPFSNVSEFFKDDARFKFTGKIPRQEALELCNGTNLILIPSRREGCPIALLEAMRSGVITVTSDYDSACKDMVLPQKTGFIIDHRNINNFIDTIVNIIDNRHCYDDYYTASYDYFKNNYSYEVWCKNMERLFTEESYLHKRRLKKISSIKFQFDKIRLFYLIKFNYCIQLLEETIFPFFVFHHASHASRNNN